MTPKSQKTSEKLVGLEGFEPPTHGLGILFPILILKQINKLARQIPNKSGKFCNLGATRILTKTSPIRPKTKIRKGANHEPLRPKLSHAFAGLPRLLVAVPVKAVLSGMGITKRKIRKLDAIARANHPEGHRVQRTYSARPFVLCGIPVRRPHQHSLEYSRQNGRFRLRVIGHPDYGLPFGQGQHRSTGLLQAGCFPGQISLICHQSARNHG